MNNKTIQPDLFDGGEPLEGSGFEDEEEISELDDNLESDINLPLPSTLTSSTKLGRYAH
jgi:hypothetical protein